MVNPGWATAGLWTRQAREFAAAAAAVALVTFGHTVGPIATSPYDGIGDPRRASIQPTAPDLRRGKPPPTGARRFAT